MGGGGVGGGTTAVRSGSVKDTRSWKVPLSKRVFGATKTVAAMTVAVGVNSMYELAGPAGPSSFWPRTVVPSESNSVIVVSSMWPGLVPTLVQM